LTDCNTCLDEDDLEIIRKQKITGRAFLKTCKEEFERYGMLGGPATVLADFAKECKGKKVEGLILVQEFERGINEI
jgi:hypothetical protein